MNCGSDEVIVLLFKVYAGIASYHVSGVIPQYSKSRRLVANTDMQPMPQPRKESNLQVLFWSGIVANYVDNREF